MGEPYEHESRRDAARAAEEASGVPFTPAEEDAYRGHDVASGADDCDSAEPGRGRARPEDLNPDDFE